MPLQTQAGGMGEQLFAVVFKRKLPSEHTKTGKPKKAKWEMGLPRPPLRRRQQRRHRSGISREAAGVGGAGSGAE